MSDFRDAIAQAICGLDLPHAPLPGDYQSADDVLAAPEMQAIREALRMLHVNGGPGYLDYLDIPASVIAWVIRDDQ